MAIKYWFVLALMVSTTGLAVRAGAQAQAPVPEPRPVMTMQQLMRGNLFPNSNVIFAAQFEDPASMRRDERPSMSTNPLAGLYGGWQAIENGGLALAEAADLMNTRGRVCSNGRPVPIQDADWKTAVEVLRESGLAAAAAARTRSLDRMSDIAEQLTNACSGCHRIYRARENPCAASR